MHIVSRLKFAALFFPLLLFYVSGSAKAQEDVLFLEPSAGFTFGQEVRFGLRAANAADVSSVKLFVQPERTTNVFEVDVPFEAGETIEVMVTVPVQKIGLRPYQSLNYGWELETSNGIRRVPPQRLDYADNRLVWQQLTENGITAHWTGEGPFFGELALDIAGEAVKKTSALLPLEGLVPFEIYVYPSAAELRTGLEQAGVADQQALLDSGTALITVVNPQTAESELQQAVPRTVTEILLYQAAGGQTNLFPWWFREGVMGNIQPTENPHGDELLRRAEQQGRTISLWRLCQTPLETGDYLTLAMTQSTAVVDYLLRTRGEAAVRQLAAAFLAGGSCEAAVQKVLGYSLEELNRAWLVERQPRSMAAQLWMGSGLWIVLLLGGAVLGGLVYRVTRHLET